MNMLSLILFKHLPVRSATPKAQRAFEAFAMEPKAPATSRAAKLERLSAEAVDEVMSMQGFLVDTRG